MGPSASASASSAGSPPRFSAAWRRRPTPRAAVPPGGRLLVVRAGDAAWLAGYVPAQGQPRQYEVRRSTQTRNESVLLDAGADLAPDSLAVSPNLVPRTRGGALRAAPLR